MIGKVTLNNMQMNVHRRSPVYQALLIDLALSGAVDRGVAESLLGQSIPEYITLPATYERKEAKKEEPKKETPKKLAGKAADGE